MAGLNLYGSNLWAAESKLLLVIRAENSKIVVTLDFSFAVGLSLKGVVITL